MQSVSNLHDIKSCFLGEIRKNISKRPYLKILPRLRNVNDHKRYLHSKSLKLDYGFYEFRKSFSFFFRQHTVSINFYIREIIMLS